MRPKLKNLLNIQISHTILQTSYYPKYLYKTHNFNQVLNN